MILDIIIGRIYIIYWQFDRSSAVFARRFLLNDLVDEPLPDDTDDDDDDDDADDDSSLLSGFAI